MDYLAKYLKKLGVKEFSELNNEEKETCRVWQDTLNGRKLTDDEVYEFFANQEEETVKKLIENRDPKEDMFLKVKLEFIRNARNFLNIPKFEKIVAENNIKRFLNE